MTVTGNLLGPDIPRRRTNEEARRIILDALNAQGIPALDPRNYSDIVCTFIAYHYYFTTNEVLFFGGAFHYKASGQVRQLPTDLIEANVWRFLNSIWALDEDGARPMRVNTAMVMEVMTALRAALAANESEMKVFKST